MKKLMSLFIAITIFANLFSREYLPSKEELEAFFKTKTLVVLEDNPMLEYNYLIQETMKANWTITEFDFITFNEFLEKFSDPQYSFLIMNQVKFEGDASKPVYNFLSVWLGDSTIKDFEFLPEICAVPVSYRSVYEDSYNYKLGTMVRFIQNHINLIYNHPEIVSSNIYKHYNENMGDIKNKTLYLIKDELSKDIDAISKIKNIYPYKVKIVTREDVKQAIDEKNDNVVFLHKIGPEGTRVRARCYKIIVGAADANFYYFDMHMINDKNPDSLLAKDLKKIAKKK